MFSESTAKHRPGKAVTVYRVRNRMMLIYTLFILAAAAALVLMLYRHLRTLAADRCAEENETLAFSVSSALNCFCQNAESDCDRVFMDQQVMKFDPVAGGYPEYEAARRKNEVKNELLELAAGKSYNDFFFVFGDSQTVGKVSVSADNYIIRQIPVSPDELLGGKSDKWMFSPSGNSRKIYYLRRASNHSVFVLSCYIDQLAPFILPEDSERSGNISIILADQDGRVILSNSDKNKTGSLIQRETEECFSSDDETVISNAMVGTSVTSDCGWRVIVSSPDPIKLRDSSVISGIMLFGSIGAACVSILIGFIAAAGFTNRTISEPENEYADPISGRLNEYGLDEKISELIETSLVGSTYAFIIIGINDYAVLRKTVSLSFRRAAMEKIINITESFFAERSFFIGRISGDRIVVFADYSEFDLFKAHDNLEKECTAFIRHFEDFTADSGSAFKLAVNIGVCIYPDHAEDFDSLLEKAEEAFADAEESGGGCTVIYSPGARAEGTEEDLSSGEGGDK